MSRTSFRLPKIYPLTDTQLSGMTHAEQVVCCAEAGATLVQLRDKNLAPRDFFTAASAALASARSHNVRLIINDRVDIAFVLKADGVHLGQDDLPPDVARSVLGNEAIIGYSTHSIDQALSAGSLPIDYLAIGPIFDTSTKVKPDPTVGLEGLRAVRKAVPHLPLVAIGGIGVREITQVLEAGADSVALISALWRDPEQVSRLFTSFSADSNAF